MDIMDLLMSITVVMAWELHQIINRFDWNLSVDADLGQSVVNRDQIQTQVGSSCWLVRW